MDITIKFTKMQGLGNDFIIVDNNEIEKNNINSSELAKKICDRNFGIGGDGLIVVNPSDMKGDTDVSWRIFNSDGTEPQMCGNGIRCFAKYIYENGIINKKKFTVQTLAGVIVPEIQENGEVRVDMGEPVLEAKKIPLSGIEGTPVIKHPIEVVDRTFTFSAVSMGNPHCLIFTEEDSEKLARIYGAEIELNTLFPEKTNVEFIKVLSRNNIKIDVWERGCGITLACGTGACASTVAAILNGLTDNTVFADLPGGRLKIEWKQDKNSNNVFMTGASEFVFKGEYYYKQ
ncbi:MAG: diaminopimelate epimerase [Candidatus Gastranaerophilales bacterium]|nr:diaminopimelate epimerase [Candidatus Gastranaerophilales bacterium]